MPEYTWDNNTRLMNQVVDLMWLFFLNLCGDVKYALLYANCARVGNHKTIKESFHCFAEKKTLTISIVTFLMICAFEYCSIMSSPNDSSLIVQSNSPV